MWRILSVFLVLLFSATVGLSEERVLLFPQDLPHSAASSSQDLPAAPSARTAAAAVPDSFQELRQAAVEQGSIKVIVGTRVPFAAEDNLPAAESREQRSEIAAAASGIRERFAEAIRRAPASFRSYGSIPFVALEVTAEELDRLAMDPDVISITENRMAEPFLRESLPLVQATQAHAAGFTGAGQTIAILDTGVDKNHPFLRGRVIEEACFSSGGWCPGGTLSSTVPGSGLPCPIAQCQHGTHVAGIAAGASSSSSGVASGANIMAIQVFSNIGGEPRTLASDYLAALEHVFGQRNRLSIAAVNMSLGGGKFFSTCDGSLPPVTAVIRNLRSAGIATVVSSGNESLTAAISHPACISSAVSVGAVSDASVGTCEGSPTARDKVACYSNSAAFLNLLAPGSRILSSGLRNSYYQGHGTSMAAPHVAGAWAVLKQKAPDASVDEVLAALQDTGTMVTDDRNGIRKPRINVKAALDRLSSPTPVLALTRAGTGRGTVTFSPAGSQASCTANCMTIYDKDTVVTLAATAAEGSVFSGWSGDCTGSTDCTLTMSEARRVTASFASNTADTRALSYTKQGSGRGTVTFSPTGSQPSCTESCTAAFAPNTMVTLQPRALEASVFKGWSGACRGMRACRIRMNAAKAVTAVFDAVPVHTLSYLAEGTGTGAISFTRPGGTEGCTGSCTRSFTDRSRVTLTAQASPGSRFQGWAGACKGTRPCTLTLKAASTVNARFEAVPVHALSYTMEGQGTVSFARPTGQAACTESCTRSFTDGARVTLTATAAPGYRFDGWQNSCRGRRACSILMNGAKPVSAIFSPIRSASSTP